MLGCGILKYFRPITHKMYAPGDKDPPQGKEFPNLFGSYLYRKLYHCHHDRLPPVTLTRGVARLTLMVGHIFYNTTT